MRLVIALKKIAGYALCLLGLPTGIGILVTCLCSGGGTKSKLWQWFVVLAIPVVPIGIVTAPIFLCGVELLNTAYEAEDTLNGVVSTDDD